MKYHTAAAFVCVLVWLSTEAMAQIVITLDPHNATATITDLGPNGLAQGCSFETRVGEDDVRQGIWDIVTKNGELSGVRVVAVRALEDASIEVETHSFTNKMRRGHLDHPGAFKLDPSFVSDPTETRCTLAWYTHGGTLCSIGTTHHDPERVGFPIFTQLKDHTIRSGLWEQNQKDKALRAMSTAAPFRITRETPTHYRFISGSLLRKTTHDAKISPDYLKHNTGYDTFPLDDRADAELQRGPPPFDIVFTLDEPSALMNPAITPQTIQMLRDEIAEAERALEFLFRNSSGVIRIDISFNSDVSFGGSLVPTFLDFLNDAANSLEDQAFRDSEPDDEFFW